jgi:Lon protease-like protein
MTKWWLQDQFEIPIFPLPNVVQFPGVIIPLHVFEPRYRSLVKDTLAQDARIALTLLQPGYENDYYGAPEVHRVTCAGQIISHQEQPDGRFYMTVMGLGRIRLQEQIQTTPYRKFLAVPLAEGSVNEASAAMQIQTFFACVQRLSQKLPEVAKAMKDLLPAKDHPGHLADVAASIFMNEPPQRQSILEILDPQLRLQQVTDAISEFILQTETKKNLLN